VALALKLFPTLAFSRGCCVYGSGLGLGRSGRQAEHTLRDTVDGHSQANRGAEGARDGPSVRSAANRGDLCRGLRLVCQRIHDFLTCRDDGQLPRRGTAVAPHRGFFERIALCLGIGEVV
jgi:hypothetical protein